VRPDLRMFDPGWRTRQRGWPNSVPPEDQGTRDSGNDPEGVVSRSVAQAVARPVSTSASRSQSTWLPQAVLQQVAHWLALHWIADRPSHRACAHSRQGEVLHSNLTRPSVRQAGQRDAGRGQL